MNDQELVRQVAEEVMGGIPDVFLSGFNPIRNANHRDMVVERMRELGFSFYAYYEELHTWIAGFRELNTLNKKYDARGKIGRAVCEAAVAAVRGSDGSNS